MFIPDPTFSIPDPGLTRSRIRIKKFKNFLPQNGCQVLKNKTQDVYPDLESVFFPSRIRLPYPGVKKHRIPGSGSATLYLHCPPCFLRRSLTCLNLAAAASGLGYAVITTIPNTLITMYHEEPELYYGSHSARAGVGEDIAILDSGYFLSQVLPSLPIRHLFCSIID
jgi:hypothetical protein